MLKRILSNDFNKNVLKLLTGSTMAQAIPIAMSPILTRLYTPEDFGILTLFVAITAILGTIVNGRYELAIVLPDKEEESINLVALSVMIAFILSSILFILVVFLHETIIVILGNEQIGIWLYFAPLVVFFIGIYNALNYLNTRMKTFGVIAKVNVLKSLSLSITQLTLGVIKAGATGLISGQIISHIFANGSLAKEIFKNKVLLSKVKLKEMKRLAKRYSNFPKYSMWAVLANSLSQHLISFYLPLLYSVSTLGFYGLVNRVLGLPTTIIGNSVGQVFFQRASEERIKTGKATIIFNATLKKLLILSLPPFIFLFIFAPSLISFVFGENWREAGEYITILAPLFMFRFINTPLSTITSVFEKNQVALIMQLSYLTLTLIVFTITFFLKLNIIKFLLIYSIVFSLYNFVRLFVFKKISIGGK